MAQLRQSSSGRSIQLAQFDCDEVLSIECPPRLIRCAETAKTWRPQIWGCPGLYRRRVDRLVWAYV